MAGQALQRIDYGDLASVLAQINNNFAIIQNSPFFKGIPGAQGIQGNTGNTGTRGSKIFIAAFDNFKAKFTELQNQLTTALDKDFINIKLGTNFQDVCDALNVPSTDTLLSEDVILLESDLGLYTYDATSNTISDTGVHLVSDSSILTNIDTLVKNSVQEYISTLSQQTICLKEIKTIATNNCLQGVAENAITSKTSYIPYLSGALVPSSLDVTATTTVADQYRHKYFSLDNELTKLNSTTPFKVSVVMGSLSEYIKTLQNGTNQNLAGNIVNPTYDKMPAMILMQNDYNSGLVIGHKSSTRMDEYGIIYKNATGALCLRREHRWVTSGTNSQEVTELQINPNEYDFKEGHIFLDSLYYMKSDFLDSYSSPMVVKLGFGNETGSTLKFDALSYWFTNGIANKVLELDPNKRIRLSDQTINNVTYRVHNIVDNDGLTSGVDTASSSLRKDWFDEHYRPNGASYNENTLKHNVPNEYTVAQMYDAFQDQLDDVWFKNEYYPLLTEDSATYMKKFNDKIPSLRLSSDLYIGRYSTGTVGNVSVTYYNIPLEVSKLTNPISYNNGRQATDVVRIGLYNSINSSGSFANEPSRTRIELDWVKLYVNALDTRSVLTIDDDGYIDNDSDYQLAMGESNFATSVGNTNIDNLDNNTVTLASRVTTNDSNGYCVEDSGSDNYPYIGHERRFLNGYHLLAVFKFLDKLVAWIKSNFLLKSSFNERVNDYVPEGTIIVWNPVVDVKGDVPSSWQWITYPANLNARSNVSLSIPYGWAPCVGVDVVELKHGISTYTRNKLYRIPDLSGKFIVGLSPTLGVSDNELTVTTNFVSRPQLSSPAADTMYTNNVTADDSGQSDVVSLKLLYIIKLPKPSSSDTAIYVSGSMLIGNVVKPVYIKAIPKTSFSAAGQQMYSIVDAITLKPIYL